MSAKLPQGQADRLLRIAFHADPDGNHPTTGLLRDMQDCSGIEAAIAAAFEYGQEHQRLLAAHFFETKARGAERYSRELSGPERIRASAEAETFAKAAANMADDRLWEES